MIIGASITGEDAGFVPPAATRSIHAVTVTTRKRYFAFVFFYFCSKVFPLCSYINWVLPSSFFPIRVCRRIHLIATNSFAKMLNKYDDTAFHFALCFLFVFFISEGWIRDNETNALFTPFCCCFRLFVQFVTLSNPYVFKSNFGLKL